MTKTIYVITERGFEYNDEYYYQSKSDDGVPKKVFYSKEEAEKEAFKMNKEWLLTTQWQEYGYDLSGLFKAWPKSKINLEEMYKFDTLEYYLKTIPEEDREYVTNYLVEKCLMNPYKVFPVDFSDS